VSDGCGSELRDEEQVLQSEAGNCDVATKLGQVVLVGPADRRTRGRIPPTVNTIGADETQPWPLQFWMGGWDGDALTGYVKGTWQIPLK